MTVRPRFAPSTPDSNNTDVRGTLANRDDGEPTVGDQLGRELVDIVGESGIVDPFEGIDADRMQLLEQRAHLRLVLESPARQFQRQGPQRSPNSLSEWSRFKDPNSA